MALDWKGLGNDVGGDFVKGVASVVNNVGKTAMNAIYPKEFEVYMVSLELTDAKDGLLYYFTFPVNPEAITKVQPQVKSIDRTRGAVIVNKTGMFVPQDLIIRGNFGRQFRFVTRDKSMVTFSAQGFVPNRSEFSKYYKSGYGCFKILQEICEESDKLDEGKARRLYFHNLALGESYLVEVTNFQANQSLGQNMIWAYDIRLKIVSPVFSTERESVYLGSLSVSSVMSGVNSVLKSGRDIVEDLLV